MEHAALKFARRVLVAHFLALALVVLIVVLAAGAIYEGTRAQAIEQAQKRQSLLAAQTARGIENFYSSILADLDLLRRSEQSPPGESVPTMRAERTALFLAPALWNQLEGRAELLFAVDRLDALRVVQSFGDGKKFDPDQIAQQSAEWLRGLDGPAIGKFQTIAGHGITLACVPVDGNAGRVLVAVVPIRAIEIRFLDEVNKEATMSATLLDESMATMATSDASLVGLNVLQSLDNPHLRRLVQNYVSAGKAGTEVIDEEIKLGPATLSPRLVTAEPIALHGRKWSLLISSQMSEVDAVVSHVFERALWWAIFVVVSMTAILVSTAVQLIRGRVRLERVRHDLLTKELSQAREIQLAWLPDQTQVVRMLDIAALNQPASHISGDFYNWFELPDGRTVVTIGDVTGHGMAAAFLMATTQLLIRTTMPRVDGDPGRCLEEVNRQLCIQVFNGQFVTMLLMVIDVEGGTIDIATAGHPAPLISTGESFQPLPIEPQLVMGIEETHFPTQRFDLKPRSSVVVYTDGVIEAPDIAGDRFGIERLQRCLYGRYDSAQTIISSVVDAVNDFRGARDLADDLTIVTIQLQTAAVTERQQPAAV